MLLDTIKNGCNISPEDYRALCKEIGFTHAIVEPPPKNGIITVYIQRIYDEKGQRVNSQDIFFYVRA